jgi:Ca2+-binding RTX toxin-like protein
MKPDVEALGGRARGLDHRGYPKVLVASLFVILLTLLLAAPSSAQLSGGTTATASEERKKWHPLTLSFVGPNASETTKSPHNPFLDYRLQVTFTGPGGQTYAVPGFFDGDGSGGKTGNVWRVRFTPDEAGTWSYQASFRKGANVAVDLDPTAGTAKAFDGDSGTLDIAERDATAPGFLKFGRLEYVGEHYLKFRDGPYWLKGGANSPENLLGYAGFDNTPQAQHTFSPHAGDWQTGDPVFNTSSSDEGKGLIGATNYLSSQEVNSIYFLPMNIGGDGQDTSPYVGPINWAGSPSNDNLHFDISKLGQWESAFAHAQRKGIHLHFVLNEAEEANKRELDDGTLGVERKLFYREMIARYGHHLALQWNISEEYDHLYPLGPERVKEFAGYIQQQDPYDHPITVHNRYDPDVSWTPFLGDGRFSITAFQYPGRYAGHGAEVEEWRQKTAAAGRPIPVSMDELETATQDNADQQRKAILWPTYLSGGQLGWYIKEEDRTLEDFRRYEELWTYTRHARSFVEGNLPFWEMEPQDGLLSGESTDYSGGQVFAKAGQLYAVYLPNATSTGTLDLSSVSGSFQKRWYNPRAGSFEGGAQTISGGGKRSLGTPPSSPSDDWVVLLKKADTTEDPEESECTITGTSSSDVLQGTEGDDTICGLGGNDTIRGLGGNDTLKGGDGGDTLEGGAGGDTLTGENGADKLLGGEGSDTIDGGPGNDTASFKYSTTGVQASLITGTATGEGSDTFASIEHLEGSPYNDTLTGSPSVNNLTGLGSADTLSGGDGADKLSGGGGNDTLYGGLGNDTITGHIGADTFYGEDGDDALNSQDGVNGNDTVNGGLGTDTCTTDQTEASIVTCP